jgi:hypothetical protein
VHILHINSKYAEQNRTLLDTLQIHQSNNTCGHIVLFFHPHRAYKAQGSHASLIMAVCAEEIAADQSPGHGVYLPVWNIGWSFSAQDGIRWITFSSADFCSCSKSIQRQTLECSTSTAAMFQCWKSTRPIKTRSYSAYSAYFEYSNLLIHLSLPRSVSIYNRLRTP